MTIKSAEIDFGSIKTAADVAAERACRIERRCDRRGGAGRARLRQGRRCIRRRRDSCDAPRLRGRDARRALDLARCRARLVRRLSGWQLHPSIGARRLGRDGPVLPFGVGGSTLTDDPVYRNARRGVLAWTERRAVAPEYRPDAEKVGYQAHSLRHLPSRKRSPDPAEAGFFRCFRGLCGRG